MKRRVTTTVIILVILSAIFAYSTYDAMVKYRLEEQIRDEIIKVVNNNQSLENVTDVEVTLIKMDGNNIEVRVTLFFGEGELPRNCSQIIKQGLEERWEDHNFEVILQKMEKSG